MPSLEAPRSDADVRSGGQWALTLFAQLARSLSHRLRTPLSVISNDLTYFQSLLPPHECARGISRCREISAVLTELARLNGAPLLREPLEVARVYEELMGMERFASGSNCRALVGSVRVDLEKLKLSLDLLCDSLLLAGFFVSAEKDSICLEPSVMPGCFKLQMVLAVGQDGRIEADKGVEFGSLTEFLCVHHRLDSHLAVVTDLLLWSNECKFALTSSNSAIDVTVALDRLT